PYIARLSFSMWHPAFPMGAYAYDKIGCKTAAMAYTDFPPGKDSTEAFKTGFEKAGGKVTEAVPMGSPVQVPDFTPFFQRIKDAKPDCMYVFIPSGAHAAGVMKAYGELGMRKGGVKLIGPMDLIPDNKLQDMGDAAIGTVVMGHYSVDLENPENKEFNKAWHDIYGKDSYPDFMSAAGWDTMHAIFDAIKKLNGKVSDGEKVIDAMKGWTGEGPRGTVMIDSATRDIVQDEHAMEVVRKPDGKLGVKILGTTKGVKDGCKELKVGRCGSRSLGPIEPNNAAAHKGAAAFSGIRGGARAASRQYCRQHSVRRLGLRHVPVHHLSRTFGNDGADGLRQPGAWRLRHGRWLCRRHADTLVRSRIYSF